MISEEMVVVFIEVKWMEKILFIFIKLIVKNMRISI